MLEEDARAGGAAVPAREMEPADEGDVTETTPGDDCARSPTTRFAQVLRALRFNYRRLYNSFAVFSLWLGCYEQTVSILPYALTAPLLFCTDPQRRISLGKVTQVSNAFANVFSSLNILSDNWVAVRTVESNCEPAASCAHNLLAGPARSTAEAHTLACLTRTGALLTCFVYFRVFVQAGHGLAVGAAQTARMGSSYRQSKSRRQAVGTNAGFLTEDPACAVWSTKWSLYHVAARDDGTQPPKR